MTGVPLGIRLLPSVAGCNRNISYKGFILLFTFLCYTSYHLSRKPISIVKSVLHRKNCSVPLIPGDPVKPELANSTACDWAPFDHGDFATLLGSLDLAYLFAYAAGMFFSGHIAERVNLRYFLSFGMVLSGIFTALFGLGYFWGIHHLWYYILIQVIGGLFQSTGWPSVVTCVGNWYGKGKRGLIMGIWNSHTSVGNILGSLIAGVWVNHNWGWSFIVPGIIIGSMGILTSLFLVTEPADVGCEEPNHRQGEENDVSEDSERTRTEMTDRSNDSDCQFLDSEEESPLLRDRTESVNSQKSEGGKEAISIARALFIPGVIEFSLCLFCAKLVSYTFLFWLPNYISKKTSYDAEVAGDLSTLFDVGGIAGGIVAGLVSDYTGGRATTCVVMLLLGAPMMFLYNTFGSITYAHNVGLLLALGFLVNGPYALITTAVSADLGTHKSLHGNAKALATVTAIIDGTGSIGAAIGPLLTGIISKSGWNNVFWMLIAADIIAMVFLVRLVTKEIRMWRQVVCERQLEDMTVQVAIDVKNK